MHAKPRILVPVDWYLPGFKAGGLLRTVANTVDQLGEDFDFHIITRDRDVDDHAPYAKVEAGRWSRIGKALVYYAPPHQLHGRFLWRLANQVKPDVVYLNSVFSKLTIHYLMLRRFKLLPPTPVILAARGMLAPEALALKATKKQAFLTIARATGLFRDVVWQASTSQEEKEVKHIISKFSIVRVAPDLSPRNMPPPVRLTKAKSTVRFVFLSRIDRMKNLDFLIPVLAELRGTIELDIWGSMQDSAYWRKCVELLARLPANIRARVLGPVAHDRVPTALGDCHFFVLPTRGENFGHAILEALLAGRPALISDQTPWRNLMSANAGWDLPLIASTWTQALQECVDMEDGRYQVMSASAHRHGSSWLNRQDILERNRELFWSTAANRLSSP